MTFFLEEARLLTLNNVIRAFLAGGTFTIINQTSLALTVFLLNTCRQTPKLSSNDLTAIKNKNAWIIFL